MYSFLIALLISRKTYLPSIQQIFTDGFPRGKHTSYINEYCIYYIVYRGHFYYLYSKISVTDIITKCYFFCCNMFASNDSIAFRDQTKALVISTLTSTKKIQSHYQHLKIFASPPFEFFTPKYE